MGPLKSWHSPRATASGLSGGTLVRDLWQRLVSVQQIAPHGSGANHGIGTYLTYRENQQAFEGIGAWDPTEVSIAGRTGWTRNRGNVEALTIGPEPDTPGAPRRVLLTHGYWQRRFGGAPTVVGQQLVIDGRPRSYIVNVRRIAQLWSVAHGQFAIELRSGQRLQSGRTDSDRIRRALSNPF